MALLSGTWRLVYSSGFASSGSLGGLRPGPQAALLPITIGQACPKRFPYFALCQITLPQQTGFLQGVPAILFV